MKFFVVVIGFVFMMGSVLEIYAQTPIISNIDKFEGTVGEKMTITGQNFQQGLTVFFGGVKGPSSANAEGNIIEVTIPGGADHAPIRVINPNGKSASSIKPFLLSFSGSGLAQSTFSAPQEIMVNAGGNDNAFELADINGDNKSDLIFIGGSDNKIDIFQNNSLPGNVAFNFMKTIELPYVISFLIADDIDGDGWLDLVVATGGLNQKQLYILRKVPGNQFDFEEPISPVLPNIDFDSFEIEAADIDNDGDDDLAITNKVQQLSQVVIIENTSTPNSISFDPNYILLDFALNTDKSFKDIAFSDLDGDEKVDLLVMNLKLENTYIMRNTSSGSISFAEKQVVSSPAGSEILKIDVTDFDKDGKQDILMADSRVTNKKIYISKNTSTLGTIAFGSVNTIESSFKSNSVDIGDLDGDTYPDIVMTSNGYAGNGNDPTKIFLYRNKGDNSISFDPELALSLPNDQYAFFIKVLDIDTDGKPDILVSTEGPKCFVFINKGCVKPYIMAPYEDVINDKVSLCVGPVFLQATIANNVNYQWQYREFGQLSFINMNEFDNAVSVGGFVGTREYRVVITDANGCEEFSNIFTITLSGQQPPEKPTIDTSPSQVCIGDGIILETLFNEPNTEYIWKGPNDFAETTNVPKLVIENATLDYAGNYTLRVKQGECESAISDPVNVGVVPQPDPTIDAVGGTVFILNGQKRIETCEGFPVVLVAQSQLYDPEDYVWKQKNENDIFDLASVGYEFEPSESGVYRLEVNNDACVKYEEVVFEFVPLPTVEFQVLGCAGVPALFINDVVHDYLNDEVFSYSWLVDNVEISNDFIPEEYIFNNAGTYEVKLVVDHGQNCSAMATEMINIIEPIALDISTPDGIQVCPGGTLTLIASDGFETYTWSNGKTGKEIIVEQPGVYIVTGNNGQGCVVEAEVTVEGLVAPVVQIVSDGTSVVAGEELTLTAEVTEGNAINYLWGPEEAIVGDPTGETVVARPTEKTTYTVSVTGDNGCIGEAQIIIDVCSGCLPDLFPGKVFSPNADGTNDFWVIEGIEDCPDCVIEVFARGGQLVFKAENYQNNWEGMLNNEPLPDGAYYYVITKKENKKGDRKTGSVSIIR